MLKVTKDAAQQIRNAAASSGADKMGLRVAAKWAPDGSIEYGMGFDAERANDIEIFTEGLTVLVSPHSKPLLDGLVSPQGASHLSRRLCVYRLSLLVLLPGCR